MMITKDFSKKRLIILALLLAGLSVIPHVSGLSTITLFSRIFIMAIYAMSYDILRGYMGFINLGHAMFFGTGAYAVGVMFRNFGSTPPVFLIAIVFSVVFSSIAAFIMGKIVFRSGGKGPVVVVAGAMTTLALGEIVRHTAERWRSVTMGADGLSYRIPEIFSNRILFYYYALIFMIVMTLVLRQFVLSPTGRVLMSIRENEQRAEFLGYDTQKYKLIGLQVAGIASGLSGVMFGILNRFANTELLSVQQTLNALLMTLVGGTGTLYGAIIGSGFVNIVQSQLLNFRSVHPVFERWLLFFGAMYVIVVIFMPRGFVGLYYTLTDKHKAKVQKSAVGKS